MQRRTTSLALAVLLLVGAAGGILLAEHTRVQGRQAPQEAFQHLVGGLGFGPSLSLSLCPFGFDPRLQSSCSFANGPVPGGSCFCPLHAGALFSYSSRSATQARSREETGDAPPP